MDQREEMVLKWLSGQYKAAEVAEQFEVSRMTLYEWTGRYRADGRSGLVDLPPIAKSCPHKTPAALEKLIVEAREQYGWGPKKLRVVLTRQHPEIVWPQPSTIGEVLDRNGLTKARPRRRKTSTPFRRKFQPEAAGELTTVDFKGQFKTGDGVYCYPLTMMDLTSRYLLACDGKTSTAGEGVWPVYQRVFREHGLPKAMQSDNGTPFVGANSIARISRLSVKLMKLGIQPVINDLGHPEQNGAHERMHATLKAATARPPAKNMREQQKRFDQFQAQYNDERPHEALGMDVPSSKFNGSPRPFPRKEPKVDYDSHLEVRVVSNVGTIKFNNQVFFLGDPLSGERIGLEPVDDGIWSIQFGRFELVRLDERSGELA